MIDAKALVLAVDDEPDILRMTKRVLEPIGYEVLTASDGDQALDIVAQKRPQVVMLDIKMPGKSGTEILGEVMAQQPDTAVIMVSGVNDVNIAVQAMKMGAFDYLVKPYNVEEIVLSVERALGQRALILRDKDYHLNLEKKVGERTEELERKMRELTALNKMFQDYLIQRFETAKGRLQLAKGVIKLAVDIQDVIGLAREIVSLAEKEGQGAWGEINGGSDTRPG